MLCSRISMVSMVSLVLLVSLADRAVAEAPAPVGAASSAPAPAAGAGVSSAAPTEDELINRGIALRESRNDVAALDAFHRAYEMKKSPRALAQVALAEQALGRWVPAEADLGHALARTDDPWIGRNKALLDQALVEIRSHLGSLQLTGGVPGAEVLVDGASVARLPLTAPLRVNAGRVTLEVRAAGYAPLSRAVIVPKRGVARETVALVGTAALPAASPPAPSLSSSDAPQAGAGTPGTPADPADDAGTRWPIRKKVGVAFGAAAVASAVVGTTFLFVREGRAQDFNDAGCGTETLTPDCSARRDKEENALAWGLAGVAGTLVLGGVSAFLLFWPTGSEPGRLAEADPGAAFRCAPGLGGGGSGASIACGGRF